jgi:hypothetical protein
MKFSKLKRSAVRINRLATSALLVAALLTACAGDDTATGPTTPSLIVEGAGHNAADHFKVVEVGDFEIESPCNGELIVFSGENIYQLTLVDTREHLDAGFSVHSEFQSHTRATGTGPLSGAGYVINDIFHENFESPSPPAPQVTIMAHGTAHITSDLPGLSFVGHFAFHGVALPSGEFKVTRFLESAECRN